MPLQLATDPSFGPLKRQMSKMMDQMSKGFYGFYPGETWTPNVNLYETDVSYLVCVDVAGVVKEEIDVHVIEQRLVLKGSRAVPTKPKHNETADHGGDGKHPTGTHGHAGHGRTAHGHGVAAREEEGQPRYRVHLMEIDHGCFSREVELPEDVLNERITATYRNGMLWIELPKKA